MFNSVVKEICFEHQYKDVITTSVWMLSLPISQQNSSLAHLFLLNWISKSSWDKIVHKWERQFLLCFGVKFWAGKFQNGNFFCPSIAHPYFNCNWYKPNNFVRNWDIFFLSWNLCHCFLLIVKIWDSIVNFKLYL